MAAGSLAYDAAGLLGPALGGWFVARASEGPAFAANGLAQLIVLALFLSIRLPPSAPSPPREPVVASLREGTRLVARIPAARSVLLVSAGLSFAGIGHMVLLPLVASEVLHGGPTLFGLLQASSAVGSILGGLYFGSRRDGSRHVRLVGAGAVLYGLGLLAFALSRRPELSALGLCSAGFGIALVMTGGSTLLLATTPPALHGRVMGLFALSYLAPAPLGCLATGMAADVLGPSLTLAVSAGLCLLLASWFLLRTRPTTR
jgi:MFS family permease